MRAFLARTVGTATIAGAALLIAGCGGGGDAGNDSVANTLDANVMLEQPGNDASAMEEAVNATEPVVTDTDTDTGNQSTSSNEVLGETSGGDTGGNVIENISGM